MLSSGGNRLPALRIQLWWQPLLAACLAVAGVVCIIALSSPSPQQDDALLQNSGSPYGYTYPTNGWTYHGKPIVPLSASPYGSTYGQPAASPYGNPYQSQGGNAYGQPEPAHRSGYVHPQGWADAVVDAHAEADQQRHDRFSIGGLTKRVMHPLESVGDEPQEEEHTHEEEHSEVEKMMQGMQPLEEAMASMQKEISEQQGEIAHLEAMIHHLSGEHATEAPVAAPASAGGEFSFSVPGTIEIGHLALPAGAYTIDLGGGKAAAPHAPSHHHEEEEEEGHEGGEGGEGGEHAAVSEDAAASTILDSRTEMNNGVDKGAVKQAATNLQRKLVEELEAAKRDADARAGAGRVGGAGRKGAKRDDSVLNSAVDMDNGVDQAAVKKAADGFLEKMILEHSKVDARAEKREQAEERSGEVAEAQRMLRVDQTQAKSATLHLNALRRLKKAKLAAEAKMQVTRDQRHVTEDQALLKELGAKA